MTKVEIYTTQWCPYCHAAKSLLDDKGVDYDEIDADRSRRLRMAMIAARPWPPHRAADLHRRDPCRRL